MHGEGDRLTDSEQTELFRMVREIYHHLGLDGRKIVSIKSVQKQAQKDVLKWKEKQSMKGHERATT